MPTGGHIPVGFMIPDPKRTWEMMGERDELMDVEPTPWYDWAKKFPGLVRFQEQERHDEWPTGGGRDV